MPAVGTRRSQLYGPDTLTAGLSFALNLQTSIADAFSVGSATPTFTRASVTYQTDFEGKFNALLSGEVREQGARRAYNQVATKSEDWTNAAWTKTIGTVTATTLTSTGANQTVIAAAALASSNYVMRVRMSRITGTGNIDLTLDNGATWTTVTLTGSAQVFSIAQTSVAAQVGIRIVTSGDAINADQIGVYDTQGVTNTNPPEYVSVGVLSAPFHGANVDGVRYPDRLNANTVASNVVTEATGARITSAESACAGGVTAGVVDASGPLGYLAERARTTAAPTTEDFSAWLNVNTTVGTNVAVAPNGTTTADNIYPTTTGTYRGRYFNYTTTAITYTQSVYVKANGMSWVALYSHDGNDMKAWFNLSAGTVGTVTAPWSAGIQALPNSWYRIWITGTAPAGTSAPEVSPVDADGSTTATTSGTNGILAWGFQYEAGGMPSTYIPNSGAAGTTVTRSPDVDQYVSAGNWATNDATLYMEIAFPQIIPPAGTYWFAGTYVDANNATGVLWDGTNLIARRRISGASNDATIAWTPTAGTVAKVAARFSSSSGTDIFLNGTKGTNDAVTTACQVGTNFQEGADGNGANQPFGTARIRRNWARSLSDGQLVALTT